MPIVDSSTHYYKIVLPTLRGHGACALENALLSREDAAGLIQDDDSIVNPAFRYSSYRNLFV